MIAKPLNTNDLRPSATGLATVFGQRRQRREGGRGGVPSIINDDVFYGLSPTEIFRKMQCRVFLVLPACAGRFGKRGRSAGI